MKGKHLLKVSDNRIVYEMTIRRNITIIRGDSATGKTTLLEMMDACLRYGDESGIRMECDVPVAVYLTDNRKEDWKSQLQEYEGSIVFIEELNSFVKTKEFAKYVSGSRSYYVLITRWSLKNLPYSVDEIYKLTEKGKYPGTRKIYNSAEHYYSSHRMTPKSQTDKVVTEDADAGYEFYTALSKDKGLVCETAAGNSNVIACMRNNADQNVLYIADGAAFGTFMDDCMLYMDFYTKGKCILWLPESFEYMILKSGILEMPDISGMLEKTYDYADSEKFVTWEKFYTDLLIQRTRNTVKEYSKRKLSDYYKGHHTVQLIMQMMPSEVQNIFR
ncbi:MAG: translation initiation factor 2 [Lachnospiraceae bacterium]|nr:translation initiation factor 2 [Lachnospiraceae bacterium]